MSSAMTAEEETKPVVKAGPIAGKYLAETIATGKPAVLMEPFAPTRFSTGKLLGEKAAASVSQ